nr:hypothetical protein [Bradyrhizobium retamae]
MRIHLVCNIAKKRFGHAAARPDGMDDVLHRIGGQSGNNDFRTFSREFMGDSFADSRRRTCHDR